MRCCIVYFSQTGNTKKVAETIQKQLIGVTGHCDIFRLEEAKPDIFRRYELAGLGLPSFYFREPANINSFFKTLPEPKKDEKPRPFFFFVTHGGTPGDTFARVRRLAHNRGLDTIGFFQCLGVDSYPPFAERNPPTAFGHPDVADLNGAIEFASAVAGSASDYLNGLRPKRPDITESIFSRIVSGLFGAKSLRFMMRYGPLPAKIIRKEKCTRCGLCVDSCPVGVVDLKPYPEIMENGCIACYNCHRVCPAGAIQCDWRVFRFLTGEYFRMKSN